MATLNRDQWIESFETQLSAVRPRLTPHLLSAIGAAAWDSHGQACEAPIKAAEEHSVLMTGAKQAAAWSVQPTSKLVANLSRAAEAAYANAVATLADAVLLFDAARHPRACALAVLAEEEFGKALVLRSCASQPRWDSAVLESLRVHSAKQGIAIAARTHFDWLQRNLQWVDEHNRTALIPVTPSMFPGKEAWEKLLAEARAAMRSSVRDREKQGALYVGVDRTGLISDPAEVGKDGAQRCIEDAGRIKLYVNAMGGQLSDADARQALRAIGQGDAPAYRAQ